MAKKTPSSIETFVYEAVTPEGKVKKGKLQAETKADAIASLEVSGMFPLSVTTKAASIGQKEVFAKRPLKFKISDRATFARQLYMLVRSGLQLTKALQVLGEDVEDPRYTELMNQLASSVMSGQRLSQALRSFPRCFDNVFISYIEAGEETGDMQEALRMLSKQLEQQRSLKLKVKAVTAYPKMMGSAILLITIGILKFLVPVFEGIYGDFGVQLPLPTRVVLAVSRNMLIPLMLVFAGIFGFAYFLRRNSENFELRSKFETLKYRVPVLGSLSKDVMLHRWATTLAGALKSGLTTIPALVVAGGASGSFLIRLATNNMVEGIRVGNPLSEEIRSYPSLFDARARAMASSGEEAGEISEMFESLGETIENEIQAQVATLGARLEVGLLIIMGVVVATLLIALYMPIFGLADAVQTGYGE